LLNDSEVSYAELERGNIMIRPAGIRGAVKDKVKVKTTDVSRFFRSTECKSPMTNYELPRSPHYWRYIWRYRVV